MHAIIEGLSTQSYKTCAEIAAEEGKSTATIYAILARYSTHLATVKNGRHISYRRKTKEEMDQSPMQMLANKQEAEAVEVVEEATPLKAPPIITTPQVLSKRVTDITIKLAFLRQVREKLNLSEKQRLDLIIADFEQIKACS